MKLLASSLTRQAAYKILSGVIVPRPIAWVSTISKTGVVNLAPFSAFTYVSTDPLMIGINVGRKSDRLKDTARNIHEMGDYVVNIADDSMTELVHLSSTEYPEEISETETLGLKIADSEWIKAPRLADTPVSMECKLADVMEFGSRRNQFIVGEVIAFHIRDSIYDNGKIDSSKLKPICRLAGPNYASIANIQTLTPVSSGG